VRSGWILIAIGIAANLAPALCTAQGPASSPSRAAKLGLPTKPTVTQSRGVAPDPFQDDPSPAAKLGPVRSAQIGAGPSGASQEELYNWGALPSRNREWDLPRPSDRIRRTDDDFDRRDRERERERERERDRDGRGATLREPRTKGKLTGFNRVQEWTEDRGNDLRDLVDRGRDARDRLAFQSDCAFDNFMSFTTNPFLAEDPRTLTEVRPLYLYQSIPDANPFYRGGSANFFGLQGRVAFTERFSLVLHKLGGLNLHSGPGGTLSSETGFSEIWLGPKFVFWRDPEDKILASAGLIFQLPFGSGGVFQDTGNISLVPYVSYAKQIARSSVGSWNLMNVTGYSLSTNNSRSDFLYNTAHLSLDLGDRKWLYPFLEMSWFHYTSNGTANPGFDFEGHDLANVGAPVNNRDFLSIAPGVRFKISEALQFGIAAEFPLLGTRDLHSFRLGLDFIWRY
jgi:hypothetical protein